MTAVTQSIWWVDDTEPKLTCLIFFTFLFRKFGISLFEWDCRGQARVKVVWLQNAALKWAVQIIGGLCWAYLSRRSHPQGVGRKFRLGGGVCFGMVNFQGQF